MSDPIGAVQREILPVPDAQYVGLTTYDAKDPDTKFPPIEPLRPPKGAPNVLILLLDDVGFGASSAFGGVIQTPTAERLAKNGLKYNRFHTTALCSPTRQALLTGRNHHAVGMGGITEIATSAPGYSSIAPSRTYKGRLRSHRAPADLLASTPGPRTRRRRRLRPHRRRAEHPEGRALLNAPFARSNSGGLLHCRSRRIRLATERCRTPSG
jgi:hypothetical protein